MRTVWSMTVRLLWLSVGSQDCLFWVRANVSLVQEMKTANTAGCPRPGLQHSYSAFHSQSKPYHWDNSQISHVGGVSVGRLYWIRASDQHLRSANCTLLRTLHILSVQWYIFAKTRDTMSTKYQLLKPQPPKLNWIVKHAHFYTDYFFLSEEQLLSRQCIWRLGPNYQVKIRHNELRSNASRKYSICSAFGFAVIKLFLG